jgi:hypothetical protein
LNSHTLKPKVKRPRLRLSGLSINNGTGAMDSTSRIRVQTKIASLVNAKIDGVEIGLTMCQ